MKNPLATLLLCAIAQAPFAVSGADDAPPLVELRGSDALEKTAFHVESSGSHGVNALKFNGRDSQITIPTPSDWGGSFSFALWVRPEEAEGRNMALLCKEGYHTQLLIDKKGTPSFQSWSEGKKLFVSPGVRVEPGTWTFLCGVYDDKYQTIALYVDGVEEGVARMDSAPMVNTKGKASKIVVGKTHLKESDAYAGELNGIRVWRRALTPKEIAAIFKGEAPAYANSKSE